MLVSHMSQRQSHVQVASSGPSYASHLEQANAQARYVQATTTIASDSQGAGPRDLVLRASLTLWILGANMQTFDTEN